MTPMSLETRAFLEGLKDSPREIWDELLDAFAQYLIETYGSEDETANWQMVKDEYNAQAELFVKMIDSVNVDILDVTGLDAPTAKELSRRLRRWNGKGRVYTRRNGNRYLSRRIRKIDLANPFIQSLAGYDDLLQAVKGEVHYYERF
jgi:hypothetical protein